MATQPRRTNYPDLGPKPARQPRAVKEPHGTARLVLEINGQGYGVYFLPIDPAAGVTTLIGLRQDADHAYHVSRHGAGHAECDCPSFVFDHQDHAEHPVCKHIAALEAVGLLPAVADDPWAGSDSERWTIIVGQVEPE